MSTEHLMVAIATGFAFFVFAQFWITKETKAAVESAKEFHNKMKGTFGAREAAELSINSAYVTDLFMRFASIFVSVLAGVAWSLTIPSVLLILVYILITNKYRKPAKAIVEELEKN